MKISELQNGQVVRARIGMAGRHEVEWQEWKNLPLYIQKNKKGEVVIVALEPPMNWAEYNPKYDYVGNGLFTAEDYYMEIEGLE